MKEQRDPSAPRIGRRRLLRRAGGVAAGVAGATVVAGAVMPSAASAASGGNLVLGQPNTADNASTTLTANNGTAGTLELSNSNVTPTVLSTTPPVTVDLAGAPLRLVPAAPGQNPQVIAWDEVGSLGFTSDGTLWLCAEKQTADWVYTTFTANQLVPITPTRILDTRTSAGRASILNASGNLDSQGRLIGGHAIMVDLSKLVFFGTAVHANMTVVFPTGGGFASLLPGNLAISGQPNTSNLNYNTMDVVPNFALCSISETTASSDVVKIYSSATTHVLLDVFGFTVNDPGQVNPAVTPSAVVGSNKALQAGKSRAEQARTKKPDWSR